MAIVGLTAGSRSESLAECSAAGMDAVTTKPVTLASLRAAIAEGLDAAGKHAGAAGSDDPMPGIGALVDELGEDAVREILATFAADTSTILQTMREAAALGDTRTVYRGAHSVAGAARNVGASALAGRASALEHDIGSFSATDIEAEIVAMQADLDAAMARLGLAPASA